MMCPCSEVDVFLTALLNFYLFVNINLKECNLAILVVNLLLFIIVNSPGAGAFSCDFTTNLAPQCRAFIRALKIKGKKLRYSPTLRGRGIQMTGA